VAPLAAAGHEPACIVTCAAAPEYRRTADDFRRLAEELNCPFLHTERINSPEALTFIGKTQPDIGVSVNWRTIVGRKCRNLFPLGIINVHLGDLPRYRGNATPNWAIINGESKTVVTLHLMAAALDAGPIVLQRDIPIESTTYIGDVYDRAAELAPAMLVEAVAGLADKSLVPRPQDDNPATTLRCYPRLPRDSEIDWRLTADHLGRLVRASSRPYRGAYTYIEGDKLTIWRAHAEAAPGPYLGTPGQVAEVRPKTGEVAVISGDGFLVLERVGRADEPERPAADVITSNRTRLGLDIAAELMRIKKALLHD